MITWIYGNSGAGKSTLAERLRLGDLEHFEPDGCVVLHGFGLRTIWTDLDLSEASRREQNLRAARLAKILDDQGVNVIVATICPYRDLREQVRTITDCRFIYLEGGKVGPEYPFELPTDTVDDKPDITSDPYGPAHALIQQVEATARAFNTERDDEETQCA